DFPTALGNPAQSAGFPLPHSLDGGGGLTVNRTTHLLQKPDLLTCYEQERGQMSLVRGPSMP
ncbi:MAG TPA: hypothetical protein VN875_15755, partial [Candidatus Binatus sp.]|nr:hypothetical protein [Candidatus Binatus sp.]